MQQDVARCVTGTTRLAKYLVHFLAGKIGCNGKPIPLEVIINAELVAGLMEIKEQGVAFGASNFHRILENKDRNNAGDDIRYLLAVLNECMVLRIPADVRMTIACAHALLVGKWNFSPDDETPPEDFYDLNDLEGDDEPDGAEDDIKAKL